ncbi:MAG: DUF4932 domain-containing protein [Marinicellaceae bacterium]
MKNTAKIFLLTISLSAWSQQHTVLKIPTVDKRIEILSIAFRLAEAWEYNSSEFTDYVNQIQKHYADFKDHELIEYIKLIRKKKDIGYDSVMSFAINITDPPTMKPLVPFSEVIPDKRWGLKTSRHFLALLNTFYRDTDSDLFFDEQAKMYQVALERFQSVHNDINHDWYTEFYGESPKGEYKTVIAAGIGDKGYGPKMTMPDGKEVIYAVIGISELDSGGLPLFNKEYFFPTVLHEFNHSFVNHLVYKHEQDLANSGQIIFSKLKLKMNEQGYSSWQIMYAEALIRASVVKYMIDNGFNQRLIQAEIIEQLENGFVWTEDLVQELIRYDKNRELYPRFENFMPELVSFFNREAQSLKHK